MASINGKHIKVPMGFERKNKSVELLTSFSDSRCLAILFERLKVVEKANSDDNSEQRTVLWHTC